MSNDNAEYAVTVRCHDATTWPLNPIRAGSARDALTVVQETLEAEAGFGVYNEPDEAFWITTSAIAGYRVERVKPKLEIVTTGRL